MMQDHEHRFYALSASKQRRVLWKITLTALSFNLLVLLFSVWTGWYLLPVLCLVLTLQVLAPFYDAPALRKKGQLIYYSPLFLAEQEKNGVITLHGGTLFDYVFVLDFQRPGRERTRWILKSYLDGLVRLIADYGDAPVGDLRVRATSYFLNERTARKIGLHKSQTSLGQTFILVFNYFPLLVAQSLAKGRLTFPRLGRIHTFEGELQELLLRKDLLVLLRDRLGK